RLGRERSPPRAGPNGGGPGRRSRPRRIRGQHVLGEVDFAGQGRHHSDQLAEAIVLGLEPPAALAAGRLAGRRRQLAVASLDHDHGCPSPGVAPSWPGLAPAYRKPSTRAGPLHPDFAVIERNPLQLMPKRVLSDVALFAARQPVTSLVLSG